MLFLSAIQIIGVTIVGGLVLQVMLGFLIHYLRDPQKERRPVRNEIHKMLGRAILILCISQIPLGLMDYLAPKPFFIIYWLWIGILVVFFFFYEVMRRTAKKLEKKASEMGWKNDQYEELRTFPSQSFK